MDCCRFWIDTYSYTHRFKTYTAIISNSAKEIAITKGFINNEDLISDFNCEAFISGIYDNYVSKV